jgi:KipI family sensor histidine kinase inhibitor
VRVLPFGDGAVLVELDTTTTVANARAARAVAAAIAALRAEHPALGVPVPAAASVLVPFDLVQVGAAEVRALIEPAVVATAGDDAGPGRLHELPVRYGGDDGPDLESVADDAGITARDVIDLHASRDYEVLFLGFAPGFAYLGEVHARLVVPRLATPRVRVPAGSIAITGPMTAVYPQASPGGWRILGRTEAVMFDPRATPPARLRPGDHVRFVPLR